MEEQVSSEAAKLTVEQVMQPKVTVGFERSVSVRPYESAKASVFIQADVPIGYDAKQLEQGLRDAFFQAKAQVFEQLGLEFEINEHGVVIELLKNAFGPVEVVPLGQGTTQDVPPTTNGAALVCGNNPSHKMWDNREKKARGEYKASAPDAKCSDCDFKLWPPK